MKFSFILFTLGILSENISQALSNICIRVEKTSLVYVVSITPISKIRESLQVQKDHPSVSKLVLIFHQIEFRRIRQKDFLHQF